MSKRKKHVPNSLKFIQFWLFIARELGSSRLNINSQACDIHNLFTSRDGSKSYLKQIVIDTYKRSMCDNLHDEISIEAVLDILGETAYQLRKNNLDDLFDIELLEEISWHISDRYKNYLSIETAAPSKPIGKLVSYPEHKIRIANARL